MTDTNNNKEDKPPPSVSGPNKINNKNDDVTKDEKEKDQKSTSKSKTTFVKPISSQLLATDLNPDEITLHINPATGGAFTLTVKNNISVADLTHLVARKMQMPKEKINLIFNEKTLKWGTILEAGLKDGSKLSLIPNVKTGFAAGLQNTEQSIVQAIEGLSDKQIDEFLSGRAPLTLALRVDDHMMFVQLQLEQQQEDGNSNNKSSSKNHHTQISSAVITHNGQATNNQTAFLKAQTQAAQNHAQNLQAQLRQKQLIAAKNLEIQSQRLIADLMSKFPAKDVESVLQNGQLSPFMTSELTKIGIDVSIYNNLLAQISANRAIILQQARQRAVAEQQQEVIRRQAAIEQNKNNKENNDNNLKKPGACINTFVRHGPGVFSGTFSGSLHPSIQDENGKPKRDPKTILQILNDLLSATQNYQGSSGGKSKGGSTALFQSVIIGNSNLNQGNQNNRNINNNNIKDKTQSSSSKSSNQDGLSSSKANINSNNNSTDLPNNNITKSTSKQSENNNNKTSEQPTNNPQRRFMFHQQMYLNAHFHQQFSNLLSNKHSNTVAAALQHNQALQKRFLNQMQLAQNLKNVSKRSSEAPVDSKLSKVLGKGQQKSKSFNCSIGQNDKNRLQQDRQKLLSVFKSNSKPKQVKERITADKGKFKVPLSTGRSQHISNNANATSSINSINKKSENNTTTAASPSPSNSTAPTGTRKSARIQAQKAKKEIEKVVAKQKAIEEQVKAQNIAKLKEEKKKLREKEKFEKELKEKKERWEREMEAEKMRNLAHIDQRKQIYSASNNSAFTAGPSRVSFGPKSNLLQNHAKKLVTSSVPVPLPKPPTEQKLTKTTTNSPIQVPIDHTTAAAHTAATLLSAQNIFSEKNRLATLAQIAAIQNSRALMEKNQQHQQQQQRQKQSSSKSASPNPSNQSPNLSSTNFSQPNISSALYHNNNQQQDIFYRNYLNNLLGLGAGAGASPIINQARIANAARATQGSPTNIPTLNPSTAKTENNTNVHHQQQQHLLANQHRLYLQHLSQVNNLINLHNRQLERNRFNMLNQKSETKSTTDNKNPSPVNVPTANVTNNNYSSYLQNQALRASQNQNQSKNSQNPVGQNHQQLMLQIQQAQQALVTAATNPNPLNQLMNYQNLINHHALLANLQSINHGLANLHPNLAGLHGLQNLNNNNNSGSQTNHNNATNKNVSSTRNPIHPNLTASNLTRNFINPTNQKQIQQGQSQSQTQAQVARQNLNLSGQNNNLAHSNHHQLYGHNLALAHQIGHLAGIGYYHPGVHNLAGLNHTKATQNLANSLHAGAHGHPHNLSPYHMLAHHGPYHPNVTPSTLLHAGVKRPSSSNSPSLINLTTPHSQLCAAKKRRRDGPDELNAKTRAKVSYIKNMFQIQKEKREERNKRIEEARLEAERLEQERLAQEKLLLEEQVKLEKIAAELALSQSLMMEDALSTISGGVNGEDMTSPCAYVNIMSPHICPDIPIGISRESNKDGTSSGDEITVPSSPAMPSGTAK